MGRGYAMRNYRESSKRLFFSESDFDGAPPTLITDSHNNIQVGVYGTRFLVYEILSESEIHRVRERANGITRSKPGNRSSKPHHPY